MIDWIAAGFLVAGGFFAFVGGVGLIRLKDTYQRMHASSKAGTLGLALICIGVILIAETWLNVAEAVFVFLFMIATAPIGAHLIGRAAFRTRVAEAPGTVHDPECSAFRGPAPEPAGRPAASRRGQVRPSA